MYILVDFHGEDPVIVRNRLGVVITFSNKEAVERYKHQTSFHPEELVSVETPEDWEG